MQHKNFFESFRDLGEQQEKYRARLGWPCPLAPKCLTFVVSLSLSSNVIYTSYIEDDHTPISLSFTCVMSSPYKSIRVHTLYNRRPAFNLRPVKYEYHKRIWARETLSLQLHQSQSVFPHTDL